MMTSMAMLNLVLMGLGAVVVTACLAAGVLLLIGGGLRSWRRQRDEAANVIPVEFTDDEITAIEQLKLRWGISWSEAARVVMHGGGYETEDSDQHNATDAA